MATIDPSAIQIQLKALNGGTMTTAYPRTVTSAIIDYAADVTGRINSAIAAAGHIRYEIPSSGQLPDNPESNVIYLIPSTDPTAVNVFDEWMWIGTDTDSHWEIIGTTQADVGNKADKITGANSTEEGNIVLMKVEGGTLGNIKKSTVKVGSGAIASSLAFVATEAGVVNYVSSRIRNSATAYLASSDSFGVVKIGSNINVSGGIISVIPATGTDYGVVMTDNNWAAGYTSEHVPTNAAVMDFVQSAISEAVISGGSTSFLYATTSTYGVVEIGTNINVANGVISIANATTTSKGVVQLTATQGNDSTKAATPALVSSALNGTSNHVVAYSAGGKLKDTGKVVGGATFVATPNASTLATEAGVSAYVASASPSAGLAGYTAASSGLMYVVSSGGVLTITSGGLSIKETGWNNASLEWDNTAGVPTAGAIQAALEVLLHNGDGAAITTPAWYAGANDYGVVKIGSNINATDGIISVSSAIQGGNAGVVTLASWSDAQQDWSVASGVPTASAVQAALEVLLHNGDGAAQANPIWHASTSEWGVVKIGSNINVDATGVISVSSAVAGANPTVGVTRLYNAVNTSTNGAVTPAAVRTYVASQISSAVPLATSSGAGIVQIGSNIEITSGGIISVPMAGDSVADPNAAPGVVFVDNDGYMTTSAVPTGIAVSAFVTNAISAATPIATSNTAGLVKVGSNLFITGDMDDIPGQLYVKDGSTASKGVVKLQSTINTANSVALTPGAVNTFIMGMSGVAPISTNITATGGTISIANATVSAKGAVQLQSSIDTTSTSTDKTNHSRAITPGAAMSAFIMWEIPQD